MTWTGTVAGALTEALVTFEVDTGLIASVVTAATLPFGAGMLTTGAT